MTACPRLVRAPPNLIPSPQPSKSHVLGRNLYPIFLAKFKHVLFKSWCWRKKPQICYTILLPILHLYVLQVLTGFSRVWPSSYTSNSPVAASGTDGWPARFLAFSVTPRLGGFRKTKEGVKHEPEGEPPWFESKHEDMISKALFVFSDRYRPPGKCGKASQIWGVDPWRHKLHSSMVDAPCRYSVFAWTLVWCRGDRGDLDTVGDATDQQFNTKPGSNDMSFPLKTLSLTGDAAKNIP